MKLSPTFVRIMGYVLVFGPIVLEAIHQLLSPSPNWAVVSGMLVTALGGSQAGRRLTDVPAEHVEREVQAKVDQVIASMPPSASHFMPPPSNTEEP